MTPPQPLLSFILLFRVPKDPEYNEFRQVRPGARLAANSWFFPSLSKSSLWISSVYTLFPDGKHIPC